MKNFQPDILHSYLKVILSIIKIVLTIIFKYEVDVFIGSLKFIIESNTVRFYPTRHKNEVHFER